jgi:hypothetical protein
VTHSSPPWRLAFAYSSDIAQLLARQLTRFVTLNRYQLAAQAANLNFWSAEVRHCLDVIKGYNQRFEAMRTAHLRHVAEHRTIEFDLDDPRDGQWSPVAPRRIPHTELKESASKLRESMYRFLVRCFRERLIDEPLLRDVCDQLEIGVEIHDLHRT